MKRWIAVAFLLVVVPVTAHEVRPAFLELTERAPGEFEVLFRFDETVALRPGYELKHDKSGGFETVVVVADKGRQIVLQHILVSKDGDHVVKHWLQDWTY